MASKEQVGKDANVSRRGAFRALASVVGGAALALRRLRSERTERSLPQLVLDWGVLPAVRFEEEVPAAHIPKAGAGAPPRMVRLRAEGGQIEKHVAEGAAEAIALRGADGHWRVGIAAAGTFGRDEAHGLHTVAVGVNTITSATMVLGYVEPGGMFVAVPTRIDSYCESRIMQRIHPEAPHI